MDPQNFLPPMVVSSLSNPYLEFQILGSLFLPQGHSLYKLCPLLETLFLGQTLETQPGVTHSMLRRSGHKVQPPQALSLRLKMMDVAQC